MTKDKKEERIIIKKYPNRRLYRTDISTYITLDDLRQMVKDNHDFIVQDAKTGEDLTQQTLVQVIFEQETGGGGKVLPINFLRKLIPFYDDSLKPMLPPYLEASMDAFHQNQQKMRDFMQQTPLGQMFSPVQMMEEMQKRNVEFFQNYMNMFTSMNPMATMFKKDEKK